jgi:hypothetical protein
MIYVKNNSLSTKKLGHRMKANIYGQVVNDVRYINVGVPNENVDARFKNWLNALPGLRKSGWVKGATYGCKRLLSIHRD